MVRVTIEDVAAHSGVSVATVSRAMRGLPNVSPVTRDRVLASIKVLDYRPDPNASRLATGRSGTVAVAASSIQLWYTAQVVAGVEAVVGAEGLDLLLLTLGDGTAAPIVSGAARRVDAIVILDVVPDEFESAALTAMNVPWALVGGRAPGGTNIWIDNEDGARVAVDHLLSLGHRRIGLIGAAPTRVHSPTPEQRRSGYRRALQAAGVDPDPQMEVNGGFSIEGGGDAMDVLLDRTDPPTAVFAMSDEMAFGAMAAARRRGLRVPDDLAVVGFDDHEVAAVMGLSTVRQDPQAMGAAAARSLISIIERRDLTPVERRFDLTLVVRSSTAGGLAGDGEVA
jgi:DNA-binding LacI/PurR family transcriptional regulator